MLVKFKQEKVTSILEGIGIYNVSSEKILSEKLYTVFGIYIYDNSIEYQILFNVDGYTKNYPSYMFEVIDNRLSRYFCFGKSINGNEKEVILISFKESVGVENRFFYSNLLDGASAEVILFEKYKSLLELEYRDPKIEESAILLDGAFLECPRCEHVWTEQKIDFEMCKCPKCNTILLNPLSNI
jgi:hypothetical protein